MNNHPQRRYIFKFEEFNLSYHEAKELLQEAPEGAEFWDASQYGKNFRLSSNPTGQYIYAYDTWCKHSNSWTSEGIVSCKPKIEQWHVYLDQLQKYFDEFNSGIEAIDDKAVNDALALVIKAMSDFNCVAAECLSKGITTTLYDLSLKQAAVLATLKNLGNVEQGMIVDENINDLIAFNLQAIRISKNHNEEFKKLFLK